ncbi:sugar-transfer associated ATP-grasp domain-containing protein [Phycisphaerales bacterium AB-hyl4]|uniref:Sugar-transfer associated ATP-grasp domain-containing protein n=1 Tax=Natronomicrosphaera hydrolytica TaxID=3242702 RepID=A0ABV4U438_9BACT
MAVVLEQHEEQGAGPQGSGLRSRVGRWLPTRVRQLLSMDHPKVTMPWTAYRWRQDECSQLRRLADQLYLRRRRFARLAAGVAWPLAAWRLAWQGAYSEAGEFARLRGGGPPWRQVLAMMWLAVRYNIVPETYYHFRFYLPERRRDVLKYIHHHDICVLFPHVRLPGAGELGDKRKFWTTCRAKGLPSVPIFAFAEGGRVEPTDGQAELKLPACGLFIKPTDWYCGRGTERWAYDPDTRQWLRDGVRCDHDQMVAHLKSLASDRLFLLQPQLRNDASMAKWTPGGLSTVRVVTFRLDDEVQTLAACMRMPRGDAHVDNFHAGGIAAAVDVATGRLSAGVTLFPIGADLDVHPDTGERIEGELLTCWNELNELARAAHEATQYTGFVGWDVTMSTDGPVVVEANFTLCVKILQMCYGKPLGDTNFYACFHDLLQHPAVREAIAQRDHSPGM